MATTVFGVPYSDITQIITAGGSFMGNQPDPGSFTDDGSSPPEYYKFTSNGGTWVVGVAASSVMAVTGNVAESGQSGT